MPRYLQKDPKLRWIQLELTVLHKTISKSDCRSFSLFNILTGCRSYSHSEIRKVHLNLNLRTHASATPRVKLHKELIFTALNLALQTRRVTQRNRFVVTTPENVGQYTKRGKFDFTTKYVNISTKHTHIYTAPTT